jgi:hypothetical protein
LITCWISGLRKPVRPRQTHQHSGCRRFACASWLQYSPSLRPILWGLSPPQKDCFHTVTRENTQRRSNHGNPVNRTRVFDR